MATFPYRPDGRILSEFFWDRSPVSIVQGPFGSGTSSACCHKIWKLAQEQAPDPLERRRSRWIIVRNTYSQLEETTMKTWADWFVQKVGGQYGDIKLTHPPNHKIKRPLKDGTIVELEVIFYALDGPDDIANLLSLEPTGFWFNEMQFTMKEMFDAAHGRAAQGRYPAKIDGGPTWCGIIGDLNAPPEGHWIPYMRGDVPMPEDWDEDKRREYTRPEDWSFFVQPPGLIEVIENKRVIGYRENPAAENTEWLSQPYKALIKGKPKSYIDTFVMNRVGRYFDGKAVFETFREEDHVARQNMEYNSDFPLLVGLDFARNPAAILGQCIRGRVAILDEFGMENVSAGTFAPLLKQRLARKFGPALTESGMIQFWGDPTGGSKGQGTDKTPFQIFASHGMVVSPAPGNNRISLRLATVEDLLDKTIDGVPALLIASGPHTVNIRSAMSGGYHFARIKGTTAYHLDPNKRVRAADYADALQYLCLGAGLGVATLTGKAELAKKVPRRKRRFSLRRRG